jgi:hypothetical protein
MCLAYPIIVAVVFPTVCRVTVYDINSGFKELSNTKALPFMLLTLKTNMNDWFYYRLLFPIVPMWRMSGLNSKTITNC